MLFRDIPEDLDKDRTSNGVLVFRGYYDGTSKDYIKGDPLLLLNVMSPADKSRLLSLCDGGDDKPPYDSTECGLYKTAVEDLYWKTLNPQGLDLCRNSAGRLSRDDPEPAANQRAYDSTKTICHNAEGDMYYRDGIPDHAFLIGLQDTGGADGRGDGIPEPFEGLGKGKALTAGNAAGTGYITLAYNNDRSLSDLPVSLQVVKVQCARNQQKEETPYRGNLLVIKSDNLFDEKLTLRHTGDFGGRPDNFEFDWRIAPVGDSGVSPAETPPNYPWQSWTRLEPGLDGLEIAYRVSVPEITIEGRTQPRLEITGWSCDTKTTAAPCAATSTASPPLPAIPPRSRPSAGNWPRLIKRVVGARTRSIRVWTISLARRSVRAWR